MVVDDGEWMIRGNHSSSFIHQMDFGKMHIGPTLGRKNYEAIFPSQFVTR
jgi:hypothetical protein